MDSQGQVDDPLTSLLEATGSPRDFLGSEELARLWTTLGVVDDLAFDDFLAAIASQADLSWSDVAGHPNDAYALRLGQWTIDLRRAGVRSVVMSSLIAAGLAERGWGEFGLAFLTAVIPSVLDIERVQISAKDRLLLADLRVKPKTQQLFYDLDALYMELPQEARLVVNRYDFANFVERVRAAGEAEDTPSGRIRIRPAR